MLFKFANMKHGTAHEKKLKIELWVIISKHQKIDIPIDGLVHNLTAPEGFLVRQRLTAGCHRKNLKDTQKMVTYHHRDKQQRLLHPLRTDKSGLG